MLFVPLYHVYGQNAILGAGLFAGATIILHRKFDADTILESVLRERVTMFFAVPTVYTLLCDRIQIPRVSSVRYWFSAAAPLLPETQARWRSRHGVLIHEGYGLTETSPFACYNHESEHRDGSVGTPIDGVTIAIIDLDDGRFLPTGANGEVVIQGPNVMLGYWNRPEETHASFKDGWFRTGDLGHLDQEGYLYIIDRLKDMITLPE